MKQTWRSSLIFAAAGFLCLGLMPVNNAFAADQSPCSADIAKFCKDAGQNRNHIMKCLERNESKLSDACREYEARMERTRVESREAGMHQMQIRQACKDDMAKFCKDGGTAQGGLLKCLEAHEAELSAPCNDGIKAMQADTEKPE